MGLREKFMKRFGAISVLAVLALIGGSVAQGGVLTDVLPDMYPWSAEEVQTLRTATANGNDRLVSCDDWTQIDPTNISGQRIITFQVGSANLGQGHLRTRRESQSDGWHFFQTTSQVDADGTCSATEQEIAIIPPGQGSRWLPLASFSLYTVAEDGGLGDLVVCQMKRWCCLISLPTCNTNPPCSLARQTDDINAGTRDVYPFHWQDQFVPIENVPSGQYWFVHTINPAGLIIESDYSNNDVYMLIEIDQETNSATVVVPPEPDQCPAF
jgi:hypothetical protein